MMKRDCSLRQASYFYVDGFRAMINMIKSIPTCWHCKSIETRCLSSKTTQMLLWTCVIIPHLLPNHSPYVFRLQMWPLSSKHEWISWTKHTFYIERATALWITTSCRGTNAIETVNIWHHTHLIMSIFFTSYMFSGYPNYKNPGST